MRVLHLDSGREMRGGQWQVLRLLRGLRASGVRVGLMAIAGSPLYETASDERFEVQNLSRGNVARYSGLSDLVHAHDARSHTLAALAARVPIVVSRRVAYPVQAGFLSRWKYGKPQMYLAISQTVAAELNRVNVAPGKVRVVYDGVPLIAQGWSPRGPVVIPITQDPDKLMDLALQSAADARVPILRSRNLETDLYGASALLYLTRSEGLGSAALLAMSAGVPVIASRVGGLREIISDGENGLLVDNQVFSVSQALERFRADPEGARQMSRAARLTVEERFSEQRMVRETIAAYESLLNAG